MKKMNIDFIKWMCDKADEFEYIRKQTEDEYYVGYSKFGGNYFDTGDYDRFIYPLLLQRAIEGVNRESKTYSISIGDSVCVFEYMPEDDGVWFNDAKSIDEEKESALLYIWEKEKEE